jgi:hypothetical protein
MKRSEVLVPVAILFFAILGCKSTSNKNVDSPNMPVAVVSPTPSLDDEAAGAVKNFWEEHVILCGTSYFSSEDFRGIITLHEYKGVQFIAKGSGPPSDADRLNGIEWNGMVQQSASVQRNRNEGVWTDWKSSGGYDIQATKRNGKWFVAQLMNITNQRKVKCEEVEGENE